MRFGAQAYKKGTPHSSNHSIQKVHLQSASGSSLNMDKCKNEETPRGDLPTTQHHAGKMALSRPEKDHPLDLASLGYEKKSRQGQCHFIINLVDLMVLGLMMYIPHAGSSSRRSAHSFLGTQFDATSLVLNGDATGSRQQQQQGGT
ncbi:hypothetical protein N7478_010265 [Penicillium angulare]|uniref:uncharacterized protein n=1 Tax=Penicillium angulare TaxID=116970 RepID=UPI00253FE330|nr:uncharacterized protein N7478_010265 [Penicillium angulare]KAJ5267457.1 hypothetical protein N7478_010265 [Penicillium angulare]